MSGGAWSKASRVRALPKASTTTAQPWMREAACAVDGVDRDLFYDDKAKTGTPHPAFAICSRCPVRPDCLAFALDNDERHGVWGGLTPEQRARLRKPHNNGRH